MQRYDNITECIEMCDRILRTNTYPRNDFSKSEAVKMQTSKSSLIFLKCAAPFQPSRTLVVQNFLPEAEVHVRSFIAMFGIVEICEVIKDDALSNLAIVQYKSRTSAADALLAMPHCQVRGSNLVVNLLWNGPYEYISMIIQNVSQAFKECSEKRVVCVGHLNRTVNEEAVRRKCERYGRVDNVQVQSQEQGAFVYVVFQSALSAAVATYCLRNSSTTNAALMLGYSEQGTPVLLGPVHVRPLDQYSAPLSAFDVRCICTRFLNYSRLKGLFINIQRKMPMHYFFKPGHPDYCIRVPTPQVKGVTVFLEVLLFEENVFKNTDEITEMAYQLCNRKYLFKITVDFGLHKPIMTHDDRIVRPNHQYLSWHSFFILDLQVCCPWGYSEPKLDLKIQGMNHVYSDMDTRAFEDRSSSSWFGVVLRSSSNRLALASDYESLHRARVKYLIAENIPFARIAGSYHDLNSYQLPVHVYSETSLKPN